MHFQQYIEGKEKQKTPLIQKVVDTNWILLRFFFYGGLGMKRQKEVKKFRGIVMASEIIYPLLWVRVFVILENNAMARTRCICCGLMVKNI